MNYNMKELRIKRLQNEVKERVVMCDGDVKKCISRSVRPLI